MCSALPSPWHAFLSDLDNGPTKPVELHCSGGFALTVAYGAPRPTDDLDYVAAVPASASEEVERLAGRGSELARKHKVCVQFTGGITDLPENYAERLSTLQLGLRNLVLKVLEPYDLVLSKLTRNSPKDRADVKYLASRLKLDFGTAYERFAREMKPWVAKALCVSDR